MNELDPGSAFRGLPLSAEQEREIEHYIRARQRLGKEWDTPELSAMIADMLNPPEVDTESETDLEACTEAERTTALGEDSDDLDMLPSEREAQWQH
jgi:hypothetical protein